MAVNSISHNVITVACRQYLWSVNEGLSSMGYVSFLDFAGFHENYI